MTVLLDNPDPFFLAHGGFQTQIEQTRHALMGAGLTVGYVEWWNPSQTCDVIHYFGRPRPHYIEHAHTRGIKVVIAELLTTTGSRSKKALALQRISTQIFRGVLPKSLTVRLAWESLQTADAICALTPWEGHLMSYLFGAPREKIHILPNGVEDAFFHAPPRVPGKYLVCMARILPVKRIVELAEAAVIAGTPTWIIGKPFTDTDPYNVRFMKIAGEHPEIIRYEGSIQDRAELAKVYANARGLALLSAAETRSITAEEAAACGCPLLLSDLPWARSVFGDTASYCPISDPPTTAKYLRAFYEKALTAPPPPKPKSWPDVGQQLKSLYEQICRA